MRRLFSAWFIMSLFLVSYGCGSRTGLDLDGVRDAGRRDAGQQDAGFDGGRDAGLDAGADACTARLEVCNDLDDDCDGVADDGIACFWLDGERVTAIDTTTCGAEWYAYGTPDSQSANPTPDIRIADGVAVAIQNGAGCSGASIAVIADLPMDGSGGELQTTLTVNPPEAAGLVVSDEDHECVYDEAAGTGICEFVWVGCCTDGVLIGPVIERGCVQLFFAGEIGLGELSFIDGSGRRTERGFRDAMEICVQILPEA